MEKTNSDKTEGPGRRFYRKLKALFEEPPPAKEDSGPVKCPYCDLYFQSIREMAPHIKEH